LNERASHYFARGHTARGACYLYASAFRGLDRLWMLSGPRGTGKSTVIRRLAESLLDRGLHVQCFHSPLRPGELDGIIATDWNMGVVDEQACGGLPENVVREIVRVDFGEAVDDARLSGRRETALELEGRLAEAYAQAYDAFAAALRIHDEWEKFYIDSMDFAEADRIAEALIRELFAGREGGEPSTGRDLFFGAATPQGAFDYIQALTAPMDRRIFVKGRPGSGKSTLLKKLAAASEKSGIQAQVFHCGFDPGSLDMLIFPELRTAIFDSTAPHEYFPDRAGDEVLDMYARVIKPGTDEAYAAELAAIRARYSAKMKEATSRLAEAEAVDAQWKALYTAATDFAAVEALGERLLAEWEQRLQAAAVPVDR